MVTETQLANLRPAQKGEVRNPYGKPMGTRSIKALLRQIVDSNVEIEEPDGSKSLYEIERAIWLQAVRDALKGEKNARRDIAAYLYGKPVQYIEPIEPPETDEDKLERIQNRIAELDKQIEEQIEAEVTARVEKILQDQVQN
jgi:hypothetical protein